MTSSVMQPNNPSTKDRHDLLYTALQQESRTEDFKNIIKLLSPPPDITTIHTPGSCKYIKVAVLGGGLAGLAAAFELRKLGFHVTLLEAEEERVGGRIYTHYFDKDLNFYGELGAMRFPVSHESTWHYIDLFNLNTRPFIQTNENAFIYVRGERVRNDPQGRGVQQCIYPKFDMTKDERNTPWFDLEDSVFLDPLKEIPPEIRKEILQIRENYHPSLDVADFYNLRQVMEKLGLSDGAIEMLTNVNPSTGGFLYNSFFEFLMETYPASFSYLYEIPGGLALLPQAFLNALLHDMPMDCYDGISPMDLGKVSLKLGHRVMALSQHRVDGGVSVHYNTKDDPVIKQEDFDFVVCTLPFSSLRRVELFPLFSSKKMQAIRILTYMSAQKTASLFQDRFWERGSPEERIIGGASKTDLPINTVWYPSDHGDFVDTVPPRIPGVLLSSYNWGQDAVRLGNIPDNIRLYDILRQLEAVHGLHRGSLNYLLQDYKTVHWNTEPWFWGAFSFYSPSENRLFSKVSITPEYNNRVFFAGEHVSVSRAWMQGSLQTGMMAANDVAKACKSLLSNL
ncbi:MAG: FAD-dependent oxidoreductase [Clostridiaceae bacterium]|nr:FAD-dependent oxidoreductase [Clostridiaceae bacterium]